MLSFKSATFAVLLLNFISGLPYAHWDECKEQKCTGINEGWMCCQLTSQMLDKGDIALD